MKTKAVRLYGEQDLRLEEFELPELRDGEILIKIVSDSVCMSTYKTAKQGAKHIRVPDNVAENPVIIGHEFCAEVVKVTDKYKDKFSVGDKVVYGGLLGEAPIMAVNSLSSADFVNRAGRIPAPLHSLNN